MSCLLPKKFPKQKCFFNLLARFQAANFVQNHGYSQSVAPEKEGPVILLQKRISSGELMKDDHQMEIAKTLQGIYEEISGYEPEEFNVLEKWIGKKRKQPPKGLYLHGAVGGGKTMLMDLFYDCCKVSRFVISLNFLFDVSVRDYIVSYNRTTVAAKPSKRRRGNYFETCCSRSRARKGFTFTLSWRTYIVKSTK